eukprot:4649181-Amphidinium_carterae.1
MGIERLEAWTERGLVDDFVRFVEGVISNTHTHRKEAAKPSDTHAPARIHKPHNFKTLPKK